MTAPTPTPPPSGEQFVIEHEPPEPIYNVIHRLPSPESYRVGTILRITEGPHEGKRFVVKEGSQREPGNYWAEASR